MAPAPLQIWQGSSFLDAPQARQTFLDPLFVVFENCPLPTSRNFGPGDRSFQSLPSNLSLHVQCAPVALVPFTL